ncbi:structural cement protein Gp24 [Clostridium sporogenes]|uniref:structural cement protein Gp24 n=1 Tax=Clostridium sporogenes TaxID=1509 RepID=UPI00024BA61D|nr:hypothetical protein [Clostridium sporogenes]EHN17031.1 hypothetical protein IYC_00597 [Clostridium sporogenes PA 3679]NFQ35216.1 hypothetical protein [Clostridium sporogenes]NFQ60586.1 hypothetical protein [Clostridium sporogenes]NFU11147.1 hypothetical protein [Clostridium sporogenes]NFU43903.1 hypothetical protein [Clostridium sporogenes]
MPGAAIGIELNLGYPGTVSRSVDTIITARRLQSKIEGDKETASSILFGEAVILNEDNTYSKFGEGNTANDFVGIAVREVKQTTDYYSSSGAYFPNEIMDVLNRGSITVNCNNGNPTAGGKVFIRIKENPTFPLGIVGQFEAIADADNTIEIPNLKWATNKLDKNRVAEVTILTRTI